MKTFNALVKSLRLLLVFITPTLFAQSVSWQQLNGPFGGTALSFASNSKGDIFAGSYNNEKGVYRSTDKGLTWHQKSNGISFEARSVEWIVVDDSSYIVIGTNSHIGARIYKSTDNGENWFETENLSGTSCAVNDSGHIYVGNTAYAQYSVSKDGGYTWTHFPHPSPFINCMAINDSGHLFIGGNYTGYRSKDNGENWTTLPLPDGINSIAVAPNGYLFAGCSREGASNSGVYRSTDNGDSWTPVKEGFRVNASHNIVIKDNGDIIVGTWGWGIWKSTDNGDTWTQHNSGLGHFYIKSLHITNNGDVYAGLDGGGIYRSTNNGESWTQVGITVASVKALAISPSNGYLFAAVNGMSRSMDSGKTWQPINNGLGSYDVLALIVKNSNGYLFAGTNDSPNGTVFRSTDNGENWARVDNFPSGIAINGLTVGLNGEIIATASGFHILCQKSTDDGITWKDIKFGQDIGCGKVAFNSAGDLFSASWGGGFWELPAGDTAWINLTSNYGYPYIPSLFVASNDYVYAGGGRSTDNGLTWSTLSLNQGYTSFAENSIGHIFCGTTNYGNGVWRSTNNGDNWEQINTGLPTIDIRSVAVDANDYLYAGAYGYSIYKTTLPTNSNVGVKKSDPATFYLENYPNPFTTNTVIRWHSPVSCWQTLKIYDIFGKEIEMPVNEYKTAGNHKTEFDGTNLLAGFYFYQLKAGKFVSTKKMILMK